jgi:polyisoprenoid-binding protein YceI
MFLRKHWLRWLIGGVVVLAALAVGIPYAYIHLLNSAPPKLSLAPSGSGATAAAAGAESATSAGTAASPAASTSTGTGTSTVAGTWTIGAGSVVGYRVDEVLMGQNTTAVGRSSAVTGQMTITGTTLSAASFSVPMSTVHSDKSQRDAQFDGRIMDVAAYPTGSFELTSPITLTPLPAAGAIKDYTARGRLDLHGVTRAVTFTLQAERVGSQIKVLGEIPVLFSDYQIGNPSFAGFVTTQNHGLLEFLLDFTKSA